MRKTAKFVTDKYEINEKEKNMRSKYKPSKAEAKAFAQKMEEIRDFCVLHNIDYSISMDSFYFCLRGTAYRVSNHTVEASNRGAFSELGQTRELYHDGRNADTIYIHASKTRIIEIYTSLLTGNQLDGRGNAIQKGDKK